MTKRFIVFNEQIQTNDGWLVVLNHSDTPTQFDEVFESDGVFGGSADGGDQIRQIIFRRLNFPALFLLFPSTPLFEAPQNETETDGTHAQHESRQSVFQMHGGIGFFNGESCGG